MIRRYQLFANTKAPHMKGFYSPEKVFININGSQFGIRLPYPDPWSKTGKPSFFHTEVDTRSALNLEPEDRGSIFNFGKFRFMTLLYREWRLRGHFFTPGNLAVGGIALRLIHVPLGKACDSLFDYDCYNQTIPSYYDENVIALYANKYRVDSSGGGRLNNNTGVNYFMYFLKHIEKEEVKYVLYIPIDHEFCLVVDIYFESKPNATFALYSAFKFIAEEATKSIQYQYPPDIQAEKRKVLIKYANKHDMEYDEEIDDVLTSI